MCKTFIDMASLLVPQAPTAGEGWSNEEARQGPAADSWHSSSSPWHPVDIHSLSPWTPALHTSSPTLPSATPPPGRCISGVPGCICLLLFSNTGYSCEFTFKM